MVRPVDELDAYLRTLSATGRANHCTVGGGYAQLAIFEKNR